MSKKYKDAPNFDGDGILKSMNELLELCKNQQQRDSVSKAFGDLVVLSEPLFVIDDNVPDYEVLECVPIISMTGLKKIRKDKKPISRDELGEIIGKLESKVENLKMMMDQGVFDD